MPKMKVEVLKDNVGFPSIVNITKNGRTMKVTSDPNMGFTIEGQSGVLPDYMEAFRVILPRVSYQKEVGVTQAEDNTIVSTNVAAWTLLKSVGIQLSDSRSLDRIIATYRTNNVAQAAFLRVTYQTATVGETVLLEVSTNSDTYDVVNNTLQNPINEPVIIRAYLMTALAPNSAFNQQLTLIGDNISLVGHLF